MESFTGKLSPNYCMVQDLYCIGRITVYYRFDGVNMLYSPPCIVILKKPCYTYNASCISFNVVPEGIITF